jgi:cytochrome P450
MTATLDSSSPADGIGALPEFRSGDPIVGSTLALRRNPLTALLEPYRRFGRIFRMRLLGRSVVVIAGLDANGFAWHDADDWDWAARSRLDVFGPNELTQLAGTAHAAKRKRLAPAFRPRALQDQVPTMADAWFRALAENADEVVDLRVLCKRLVVQSTGRAVLRVDLPEAADDDIARVEHDLIAGAAMGPLRKVWSSRPSYRARRRDLTALLTEAVRERRRDWCEEDLISEILRGLPNGAVIPPVEELVGDAVLLLQAGSDATAHQILWTLLLLQSRPDWTAELRAELDTWSPEAARAFTTFPKLRATVLEAERLRPAIPFAVRVAATDLEFSSRHIPQGATVLHASTLTHFLDEIYDDPLAFRPERFLGTEADGEHAARYPDAAHATFGGGAHACIGQPFAHVQVPLGVAVMTKHAELVAREPVSLRARLDGVLAPVERALPTKLTLRAG